MKKLILIVAVAVLGVLTANAQIFVGGSVGLDIMGGNIKAGSTSMNAPSILAIQVAPKVGFNLSDDLAVGVEAGFSRLTRKTPNTALTDERKVSENEWQAGIFARYNLIGTDKLSLLLEGGLSVAGRSSKTTLNGINTDGNPIFIFAIRALPVVSYNLSEKLNIELSCDFLRIGFEYLTWTQASDKNNGRSATNFGLGVNSSNYNVDPANHFCAIAPLFRLGVVYKL